MPGAKRGSEVGFALLATLVTSGCDGHLVGMRDVGLEYRVADPLAEGAVNVADLRDRVLDRLHAADLAAEVRTDGAGHLHVTADEGAIEEVDDLVMWPGGLSVYVVDPGYSLEPRHLEGAPGSALTGETEALPGGGSARYFVGPPGAVARAARSTPPSEGHRLLSDPTGGAVARTRVVFDPPIADLRDAVDSAEADGAELTFGLTPAGRAAIARAASVRQGREVAFVRDASILSIEPIGTTGDGRLRVRLGSSPRAYTRAETVGRLLRSPRLPHLARMAITHNPPSYALGLAEVALPILMSLAWLAFVRRFDRARPEPLWLVLVTFALGGAAVIPASYIEWRLGEASPYTNPQLMTYGGQLSALPLAIVVFASTVGLVEEGAKLLAAWAVARQRREFDEPVDGIVYAAAAALGFAALENVRYFAAGRVAGAVVVTRAFMSAPAHFLFSALWGYALGQKLVDPRRRVLPYFLLAVAAHGVFDACLSFPATARLAPLVNFGLASAFVVMLRRALRYGPVGPKASVASREAADVFPMGSRALFAAFVVALHAAAALVFALGVYIEQSHDRISPPFILAATILLGVVGATAYGVSASLPLDVVLDDAGVTFGGAFVAWEDVARVERRRGRGGAVPMERIVLSGQTALLTLGPASVERTDALVAAVYTRMALAASRGHAR